MDLGPCEWRLSCKGSYSSMLYLRVWYIRRKDTRCVTTFYCIRMLQLILLSIRQYRKHNFPFMRSSGLCLLNNLHNNVAVNRGGREFGTQRRDTGVEKEWWGTMDDSGAITLIQALVNAKTANKWLINTHSHSDFAAKYLYYNKMNV